MSITKFKRKKNSRYRGSQTHGGGSMKKRRGAGHRGGRGNAGSGKRGDSNKPTFIIAKRRYGRFGFSNPTATVANVVNVGVLQSNVTKQVEKGKIKKMDQYEINLTAMKIDKLLGTGNVTDKFVVTVATASPSAVQKIEAAGGKVVTTQASSDSE